MASELGPLLNPWHRSHPLSQAPFSQPAAPRSRRRLDLAHGANFQGRRATSRPQINVSDKQLCFPDLTAFGFDFCHHITRVYDALRPLGKFGIIDRVVRGADQHQVKR